MKNITALTITLLAIFAFSCSSLQKTDVHSQEEVMKMDALALAELQCKAEYYKLMAADSATDINLQNKSRDLNEAKDELSVKFFRKYYNNTTLKTKFEELTKTLGSELTACKKLEEYKIMQETINGTKPSPGKK